MRVSWLIPFTAGMFVVPTLYGVIGDDARNHIDGLALSLRTQFQASFPPRDNTSAPVVNDSAPRAGLQGPQSERGPNKAESPVEGRAPDVTTPKADVEVDSPGGRGTKVAPVPGPPPVAERPERNSGDPGPLGPSPRVPKPPDVTVRPSGEGQVSSARPKAEPKDHAVLAPPEERRIPDAPEVKVAPNTPTDPGPPPPSPGLAQSPSSEGKAPPPNAYLADRGAAAPPPDAPSTQALKADPGPPTPHTPSGVARRPPGERPGERNVRGSEAPSPAPGDHVVPPTGRGPQSLGVRADQAKPATHDQHDDRKAPHLAKPRIKLRDPDPLLSDSETGSLGLKAGNPVAQSQGGAYRTRSNRWTKKNSRIRHRELSGVYQYSKRSKRHGRAYYYDHHYYGHPTADQHKSREWTERSGCDAAYMPYGYTWVLTRDPRC